MELDEEKEEDERGEVGEAKQKENDKQLEEAEDREKDEEDEIPLGEEAAATESACSCRSSSVANMSMAVVEAERSDVRVRRWS